MTSFVVEDHFGADAGDFAPLGQGVEYEVAQGLGRRHRNVHHDVFGAGRDEDLQGFGQLEREVAEAQHDVARLRSQPDGDHRLHGSPQLSEVDGVVNPGQDAALPQ